MTLFSFLIVKIKEDIKTLMLQKIINILIITASLLNVRSENSTNSKIVAQLQKNTSCVISKTENNWGYITSPVTGWVFLDYVKKV